MNIIKFVSISVVVIVISIITFFIMLLTIGRDIIPYFLSDEVAYEYTHYGDVFVDNVKHSFEMGSTEISFLDLVPGEFLKVCLAKPYESLGYSKEIELAGYDVSWGSDEGYWAVLMFLQNGSVVPAPINRSNIDVFTINTNKTCVCDQSTVLISKNNDYSKYSAYSISINNSLCSE